jgi:hypothetical protein
VIWGVVVMAALLAAVFSLILGYDVVMYALEGLGLF